MSDRRATVAGNRDDVAALARALADDPRAPALLWRRYGSMVTAILRRFLGPGPDNEDLAQEVFLAVCRKGPTIRDPRALKGFVGGTTVIMARHELRRRMKHRRLLHRAAERVDPGTMVPPPCISGPLDLVPRFYSIVNRLPPAEREAYVLRFFDEMKLAAIGNKLAVSLATVKRRIKRGHHLVAVGAARDPWLSYYLFVPA